MHFLGSSRSLVIWTIAEVKEKRDDEEVIMLLNVSVGALKRFTDTRGRVSTSLGIKTLSLFYRVTRIKGHSRSKEATETSGLNQQSNNNRHVSIELPR